MEVIGCNIFAFICIFVGAREWQPYRSATILLRYAPPNVSSVIVLFLIFGKLFIVYCYTGMPSLASLAIFELSFFSASAALIVDCKPEHAHALLTVFLAVSSEHHCCGEEPSVLKPEIINQSIELVSGVFRILNRPNTLPAV